MKQQKYYVVWKGRQPGIYTDWEACAAQVTGFPGAQYKAFGTHPEAERAYAADYNDYSGKPSSSQKWLFASTPPEMESYVVDAACSGSPGRLEWRGIYLASGNQIFHAGPYARGTNNIGEFLAIVQALIYLEKNSLSLPVYSDSDTAISWVRHGRCNTKLKPDFRSRILFDLIRDAEDWLKEHPGGGSILKWDTLAWGENPADFNRK